jgi:hypothetical protein
VLRYVVAGAVLIASGHTQAPATDRTVPFLVVARDRNEVRVHIGELRSRASLLTRATVLTPSGAVLARLIRSERKCEYLCGGPPGDERVCHFEAILRASQAVSDPVAVLPGTPTVQNVAVPAFGAEEPVGPEEAWVAAEPVPLPEKGWEVAKRALRTRRDFSWRRYPDGVFLADPEIGRDFYAPPIDLLSCTRRATAPFTMMSCAAAELLYEGSRGVVMSVDDYGEGTVEPILRLRLDGSDAFVIRLGLKGEATVALLIRQGAGWLIKFRASENGRVC